MAPSSDQGLIRLIRVANDDRWQTGLTRFTLLKRRAAAQSFRPLHSPRSLFTSRDHIKFVWLAHPSLTKKTTSFRNLLSPRSSFTFSNVSVPVSFLIFLISKLTAPLREKFTTRLLASFNLHYVKWVASLPWQISLIDRTLIESARTRCWSFWACQLGKHS